jgi:Flp pilus assembly protein TadD
MSELSMTARGPCRCPWQTGGAGRARVACQGLNLRRARQGWAVAACAALAVCVFSSPPPLSPPPPPPPPRSPPPSGGFLCLRGGSGGADSSCEFRAEGRERLAAGQLAAALYYFEKAVHVAPDDAESMVALGRLLDQVRGNQQAAFDLFVRAVEIAPDSLVALSNYAFGLENWCHRNRHAEEVYTRAMALDPANVPVLVNLAALLEQPLPAKDPRYTEEAEADRVRQAHDLYARALALQPDNRNTLCNFAGMLMTHGDQGDDSMSGLQRGGQRASQLLAHALELAPDDSAVLINYGVLMEDWGDNKELARRLYARAVEVDPANSAAVCSLTRILRILQRLSEADAVARAAIALYPANSRCEAVLDIERELWRVQQCLMESTASHGQAAQGGVGQAHLPAHPRVERDIAAAAEALEEEANSESSSISVGEAGAGAGAGGRRNDMEAARARRARAECRARRVGGGLQVSKANAAPLDGGRGGVAEAGFDKEAALTTEFGDQMCGERPGVGEGLGRRRGWVHDSDGHGVSNSDRQRENREQHVIVEEEDSIASGSCGEVGSTASDGNGANSDDWDRQLDLDAPD